VTLTDDLERTFKVITITLSLRIYITDDGDYGAYRCVASNALGRDQGLTYLDGQSITVYKTASSNSDSYIE